MSRKRRINEDNLTPTQKVVKKSRPVFYDGPNKNADPDTARDIITMYVTFGMGYSAIRHVIGAKSDRLIEDIIRQHMFGRKSVDIEGELYCPGSSTLDGRFKSLVQELVKKYGTGTDPYIVEMLTTGRCGDDPAYGKKLKSCPKCEKVWETGWNPDWVCCPFCGWKRDGERQKRLFTNHITSHQFT